LTDGVTYYYQVTPVTGGVESGRSSEVSATPILAPPANLVATPSAFTVTLGWTAYPGVASHNLYRGTSSGGEVAVATGITGTSFIDTGLSLGTIIHLCALSSSFPEI
jgi:pectate lyase